jgi:DNA-binding HxlR family transcriptional regulator
MISSASGTDAFKISVNLIVNKKRYALTLDPRVAEMLRRIGDKWSVLIIVLLELGPRRFNDLKRSIPGISQRMLTLTLRNLERDGLVNRTVTPSIPPFVSYDLTPLGQSLAEPVHALCTWAEANVPAIDVARVQFDESPSKPSLVRSQSDNFPLSSERKGKQP